MHRCQRHRSRYNSADVAPGAVSGRRPFSRALGTCGMLRRVSTLRARVVRRDHLRLPPPLRLRRSGDAQRPRSPSEARRYDGLARFRGPSRNLVSALAALYRRCSALLRPPLFPPLAGCRRIPRTEHPRLLPPLARGASARHLAGRRLRGRAVASPLARRRSCDLGSEGEMKVRAPGRRSSGPLQPSQSTETVPAHEGNPPEAVVDAAERLSPAVREGARPAFYALGRGGWRDYITLLHPPYTLWHLSYVVLGAALAPAWHPGRLGAALAAFFLAVGVGAHALDELRGRPLGTLIPRWALVALAAGSIAGATAIGIAAAADFDLWLLAFIAFGAFVVCAYNLELFGGRVHNDLS